MEIIVVGDHGKVFTSDYVVDETLTVILARTKNLKDAIKAGMFILGELKKIPKFINNYQNYRGTIQVHMASIQRK